MRVRSVDLSLFLPHADHQSRVLGVGGDGAAAGNGNPRSAAAAGVPLDGPANRGQPSVCEFNSGHAGATGLESGRGEALQ